jgi:predicted membrane protein
MYAESIQTNLMIMFGLAPVMVVSYWLLVRLVNWSEGINIKKIREKILEDSLATAVYRVGVLYVISSLVIAAYGRIV